MQIDKNLFRKAGLLYLLVAIFGGFAHFGVRLRLIDYKNAQITVQNIKENEFLFRLGFSADIVQLCCFILLLLTLYKLLKPVSQQYARTMFVLAITGIPIACLNMLNQMGALLIVNKAYLNVFEKDQLYALSLLFLDFHNIGYAIAHIFFGLWLFPLGYLAYISNFIPKTLGILLMIATFGYLIHMLSGFLFPQYEAYTSFGALFSGLSEMIFILWLLVKGLKPNLKAA